MLSGWLLQTQPGPVMGSKAEKRRSGSDSAFDCDGDSGAGPPSSASPFPTEYTTETTGYFKESDTKVGQM